MAGAGVAAGGVGPPTREDWLAATEVFSEKGVVGVALELFQSEDMLRCSQY